MFKLLLPAARGLCPHWGPGQSRRAVEDRGNGPLLVTCGGVHGEEAKQQINSWGMTPTLVLSEVPALLSGLAKMRRDADAAHGNVEMRSATLDEANLDCRGGGY